MAGSRALRYASVATVPIEWQAKVKDAVESQTKIGPVVIAGPKVKKHARDPEHQEQVVLINRLRCLAINDPRYALAFDRTFAVPNGGGRSKREAGRLKAEGVKPGVSDLVCLLPVGECHGLVIEMKSLTGFASREQKDFIEKSRALGYVAEVCRGADAAFKVWKAYVDGTL